MLYLLQMEFFRVHLFLPFRVQLPFQLSLLELIFLPHFLAVCSPPTRWLIRSWQLPPGILLEQIIEIRRCWCTQLFIGMTTETTWNSINKKLINMTKMNVVLNQETKAPTKILIVISFFPKVTFFFLVWFRLIKQF